MKLITHVQLISETLITAPNVLAWECDICHFRQVEPNILRRMELLIGQEETPPPNRYQPPNPSRRGRNEPVTIGPAVDKPKSRIKAKS